MAASEVAICNSALAKIGAARISSLTESSVEAKLCREQYEKVRDDLLRSHPWNFAIKRASLAALPDVPAFGYSNAFALPADCLRVLGTDHPEDDWVIEGGNFLINAGTTSIRYVSKEIAPGKFDANFAEALACKLAHDICFSLVQSVQLKEVLYKDFKMKIAEARSYDAQENGPMRVYADQWLNSRY